MNVSLAFTEDFNGVLASPLPSPRCSWAESWAAEPGSHLLYFPVPLAVCATGLCKGLSQVSHATLQRHLSQSPDLTELQSTTTRSQQRLLTFTPVVRQKPILSWNPVVESRTGFILGSGLLQLKASPGGSCGGECLPCGFGVFILQAKH